MASTCMREPCYPGWLDNLADGVTGRVRLGTAPSNERRPSMKSWSLPANYGQHEAVVRWAQRAEDAIGEWGGVTPATGATVPPCAFTSEWH